MSSRIVSLFFSSAVSRVPLSRRMGDTWVAVDKVGVGGNVRDLVLTFAWRKEDTLCIPSSLSFSFSFSRSNRFHSDSVHDMAIRTDRASFVSWIGIGNFAQSRIPFGTR